MKTKPVPGTDHLVKAQFPALGEPFQALLWIPEFSHSRTAFCSGNVARYVHTADKGEGDIYVTMSYDDNDCPRCAPFDSFVNANCGTTYHVIPITRTLTTDELEDIGQAVADHMGKPPNHYDRPIRALRSDRMIAIAFVLAARELLTATLIDDDIHGKPCLFYPGMPVTHETIDGQHFPGTVKSIEYDTLEIYWPDGESDYYPPNTLFAG